MQNLKFLASTISEIWRWSQNFESSSHHPFAIPFDVILHFFANATCTESMGEANILIGNRYMVILLLCRFGCEMPIPAHFGKVFWGFGP